MGASPISTERFSGLTRVERHLEKILEQNERRARIRSRLTKPVQEEIWDAVARAQVFIQNESIQKTNV